jgi:hypothetical protein
MASFALTYPDWKAPAEDGKLIIWPQPAELLEQIRQNQRNLSQSEIRIQHVALREIRRGMREFLGHTNDAALLASGHQTELYHPGVWAKDALIAAAAERVGGQAFHIAVDTDAPKHLLVRWPGGAMPISDDPQLTSASWCGLLQPPTPAHLESLQAQFTESAAAWDFQPLLPQILSSLRRLAIEATTLSASLTNAQHALDWDLGLRHHALLASPLFQSAPFLLFVHHILSQADRFAADYNATLQQYRDQHGMNTRSRPMPDLFVGNDAVETPFWLDNLATGQRSRPSVFRGSDGWVLQLVGGEQFALDASAQGWDAAARMGKWLTQTAHRLAPRALTLTTFLRLCLVDQFVHGIGGGRYDQVTDRLIASHFDIQPPHFCVTTATLLFPEALNRQRVCVPCVVHDGHRLRHGLLGERKMQLVGQIAALPRRSHERQSAFHAMHDELESAARTSPQVRQWHEHLLQTQRQEREEQTLFDRELFYAIQPRERLLHMIQRYRESFA